MSVVVLAACGQGSLELEGREVPGEVFGDTEVFYLEDAFGVVVLEPTISFDHVEFHTSVGDVEVRILDPNGAVVTDWSELRSLIDDSDPVAYEGTLNLPDQASRMELRLNTPVDFGRFAVGQGHSGGHDPFGADEDAEGVSLQRAHPGRWVPPAHIVNAGNQQYLPYTGAPSRCAGTMRAGTRALAQHLMATFSGARSYGGYNCRANTANPSELSVHASGRAIDLFVPLSGGQADNDLGDPIANYLVQNAQRLGVEFIVWDRTSWGAARSAPKHRYYGGPHPHHDHLHIELAPWAANNGGNIDQSPRGYLDIAGCSGIRGWAQDPDVPHQPIDVYISIGGPIFTPGAHGIWAVANERRQDLCSAIGSCDHGWYTKLPHGLFDGVARSVYAYGIDRTGGANVQLNNVKTVRCGTPSLPYNGSTGIKRHVPNPETFARWGFQWNDIITISNTRLNSFATGARLPASPTLRSDGPPVYLVEGGVKRHVPNPRAMNAWGLDWGAIRAANTSNMQAGKKLEGRPYLVRGSGPAVYLLWPK